MRWERLFQDLEDQIDRETDAELADMARDEERLRISKLTLADRLRSASQSPNAEATGDPSLWLRVGGVDIGCHISRVGRDWLLAEIVAPRAMCGTAIIPLSAISWMRCDEAAMVTRSLAGADANESAPRLATDIGIVFVLRDLGRRRRRLVIVHDGCETEGTVERVGKDHVDIANHERVRSSPADAGSSRAPGVTVVPLARIDAILLP